MTKYPEIATKLRVRASEDTGRRVAQFLRNIYPRKTADSVAADTDIAPTTIATWLEGRSVPGGIAMMVLIDVYGPEFLAAVAPKTLGWISEAAIKAKQEKLEQRQAELDREWAELQR